jgi:hypothetical protein
MVEVFLPNLAKSGDLMYNVSQDTLPTVFEDSTNPPNSPALWLEETPIPAPAKETQIEENSDSDMIESEEEDNSEDDDDSDDEWSCQVDNLQAIVLEALGGDLEVATHLILVLHKTIYTEFMANIAQKFGSRRNGLPKSTPPRAEETTSNKTTSSNEQNNDSRTNPRKRQRRPHSVKQNREADEDEDDGDEDNQDGKSLGENHGCGSTVPLPRLAGLFHRLNPAKYGIQHGKVQNAEKTNYQSCAGPGFKSI